MGEQSAQTINIRRPQRTCGTVMNITYEIGETQTDANYTNSNDLPEKTNSRIMTIGNQGGTNGLANTMSSLRQSQGG